MEVTMTLVSDFMYG